MIFDDVFVPNERIFLDGEVSSAALFAHSLGLWERLGGLTGMADGADVLVGLAQLIAEANGLAGQAHIKEKISEMIIHATVVRACYEAAIAHSSTGVFGAAFPNELYTNAGKYTGAASYNLMVRHLHDIAGGAVVTAPSISDLENAEVGAPRPQVHVDDERCRRRVPDPAVPRHPRPHRRLLRRLEPGDEHPGRWRPVRPAHRDPQALRPRRRQARRPGVAGLAEPTPTDVRRPTDPGERRARHDPDRSVTVPAAADQPTRLTRAT